MELIKLMDKTMPRLIQFHTLKNVVNPPFLGGFSIFGDASGVGRTAALPSWLTFFKGTL